MHYFELIAYNLFSAPILFFVLGFCSGLLKSDLDFPKSIKSYFSIYLMMAIGFKGGVTVIQTTDITIQMFLCIAVAIAFSFLQPFIGYWLIKRTVNIDNPTAAAVAAQYGSVSIVTFATAVGYLKIIDVPFDGYIVAILALMEAPAILSGLFIAHRTAPYTLKNAKKVNGILSREIFTNGAILLILGSFIIGLITGDNGMRNLEGFLVAPFQGFLSLFLLDMGIVVAKEIGYLKTIRPSLILFGIYMPIIGALIGVFSSYFIGLSVGSTLLLTVLMASASYIAVPSAMRVALPQAKASVYLPLSLAITFPFNVIIGIPLYHLIIELLF